MFQTLSERVGLGVYSLWVNILTLVCPADMQTVKGKVVDKIHTCRETTAMLQNGSNFTLQTSWIRVMQAKFNPNTTEVNGTVSVLICEN